MSDTSTSEVARFARALADALDKTAEDRRGGYNSDDHEIAGKCSDMADCLRAAAETIEHEIERKRRGW